MHTGTHIDIYTHRHTHTGTHTDIYTGTHTDTHIGTHTGITFIHIKNKIKKANMLTSANTWTYLCNINKKLKTNENTSDMYLTCYTVDILERIGS